MKQRENQRWIDERKDKEGNLLCLIPTCNNLREKHKTRIGTRNYCKKHTWIDMRGFTSWQDLRIKVLKRDNYTCVKCGFESGGSYPNLIADHIVPIALGGEEFDLKNIQTLCKKCNKIKTKKDMKDITKQRRIEKKLIKGQKQIK